MPSTKRTYRLICAVDDENPPESIYDWRERTASDAGSRVTVTVHLLSHMELASCQSKLPGLIEASTLATVAVDWPGGPSETDEALEALPYAARIALGSWIYERSALPPDPTDPPE